jgi:hypothetical protein
MVVALVAASTALAQAPPADRALLETLHEAGQAFRRALAEPNTTIAAVDEARQKLEHETSRLAGRGAGTQDQRIVDLYAAAAHGYQEARNRFGADHAREHYLADVRQIETELAEADNLFQGAPPIVSAVAPTPPPPAPPQKRAPEHTVPVPPADLAPPAPVPPPMPPAHSPEPPTHATPPTSTPAKRPSQSAPPPSAPVPSATAPPVPPVEPAPPPAAANVAPPPAAPRTAPPATPKSASAPEELPRTANAPPNAPPAPIVPPPPSAPSAAAAPPAPPSVPESHAAPPAPPAAPIVAEAPPPPPTPLPESHEATPAPPAAPLPAGPVSAEPSPVPGPSGPRHGPPIVSRAPIPTTPTGVRKAADKVRIEKNAGAVVDRCSLLGEVATGDVRSGVHEIGGHNFLYEDALGLARLMTVEAGGDTLLVRERTRGRVTGDAYLCSSGP